MDKLFADERKECLELWQAVGNLLSRIERESEKPRSAKSMSKPSGDCPSSASRICLSMRTVSAAEEEPHDDRESVRGRTAGDGDDRVQPALRGLGCDA